MCTTTPTTDTTHDVTRAQLENALHALRHALRATTPLIGAVEDGTSPPTSPQRPGR
jgi:hypothetical protein